MTTTPPTNPPIPDDPELKDALADIFADAADKVAPKQPNGSIERKIALEMVAETLLPLLGLFESRLQAVRQEAREQTHRLYQKELDH